MKKDRSISNSENKRKFVFVHPYNSKVYFQQFNGQQKRMAIAGEIVFIAKCVNGFIHF